MVSLPDVARLFENDFRIVASFFELRDVDVEDYYRVGQELIEDVRKHQRGLSFSPTC